MPARGHEMGCSAKPIDCDDPVVFQPYRDSGSNVVGRQCRVRVAVPPKSAAGTFYSTAGLFLGATDQAVKVQLSQTKR